MQSSHSDGMRCPMFLKSIFIKYKLSFNFVSNSSLDVSTLARFEPERFEQLKQTLGNAELPSKVYFNKGL